MGFELSYQQYSMFVTWKQHYTLHSYIHITKVGKVHTTQYTATHTLHSYTTPLHSTQYTATHEHSTQLLMHVFLLVLAVEILFSTLKVRLQLHAHVRVQYNATTL